MYPKFVPWKSAVFRVGFETFHFQKEFEHFFMKQLVGIVDTL